MCEPLRLILRRLDRDRPVIPNGEFQSQIQPHWDTLGQLGLLRERAPAGWITCDECGGGHRCRLEYLTDHATQLQSAFASCPECGVYEVPRDQLRRWTVDVDECVNAVFAAANVVVAKTVRVDGRLWRIGKATLAGRSRELFFARCYRRDDGHSIVSELRRRPKAIVFVPTEDSASRIAEAVPNPVIALESVTSLDGDSIRVDVEHIEGRLIDFGLAESVQPKKRPKKRGDRAANIQRLRGALIDHVNAARDHAKFTKEETGTPKLLRRPTRTQLAEQVGLKPYEFTRCFKDETAVELRLLWEAAADLDRIIGWTGPIRSNQEDEND